MSLSTDQGLSQIRVLQIVQGDHGFMWFGSQYGLNRYDGYKFKVFRHEPGNPDRLSGVFISSLFKDRAGSLWVGCDEFLDKFDPLKETFTHYRIDTSDAHGETVPVTHISEDHASQLWLSTLRSLFRLDPSTGQTIHDCHDPNNPSSLSSDEVKQTGAWRKEQRSQARIDLEPVYIQSSNDGSCNQEAFGCLGSELASRNGGFLHLYRTR